MSRDTCERCPDFSHLSAHKVPSTWTYRVVQIDERSAQHYGGQSDEGESDPEH
jgi:hypothetical protein